MCTAENFSLLVGMNVGALTGLYLASTGVPMWVVIPAAFSALWGPLLLMHALGWLSDLLAGSRRR